MRNPRWTTTALTLAVLIAGGWYAGYAQTSKQKTTTATVRPAAALDVAARTTALQLRERERISIVESLEFSRPPRFFFCFFPLPTPAAAIDPHRSLFVHDRPTLDGADFTLRRTLTQIANQVAGPVPGTTAASIFRQFWDTQNSAPGLTGGPHCSDNGSTVNGFPIDCPRAEGNEAAGSDATLVQRMSEYTVLSLVNRIDLAHQGWRNCGEYRIIYGKRAAPGRRKNLIIFEAVLPNPRPGCREGCLPVAQFWKSLSGINDPNVRAKKLEEFFYRGLPGFRPVVHVNHYSANGVSGGYGSSGSGQIRTNQFLQGPWLLKEFKTVVDCGVAPCTFEIVPIMVKVNPHGPLWNEDNPAGANFRSDVATPAQLTRLSSGALMQIGYEVDLKDDAGQSRSQGGAFGFIDNYRDQMNSAAGVAFRTTLGSFGALTADQIANRALTQSCAGCHMPATFGINVPGSIGTVTTPVGSPVAMTNRWPDVVPAGFVHVDTLPASVRPELAANPAAFGAGVGQEISPALLNFFLPERTQFLIGQLNAPRCACVNRFHFLPPPLRTRALEIEKAIDERFAARFEELDKQLAQSDDAALDDEVRAEVLLEREKALITELTRAGIKVPEGELLNLEPQPMRLKAGKSSARRVAEVNELLRKEPPRRTVTGSFRSH